jgi:hypothetical protein
VKLIKRPFAKADKFHEFNFSRSIRSTLPKFYTCAHITNKKAVKRDLSGEQLAKSIAESIFGWKDVHKYGGQLLGKKQDRAGRWQKYKVPDYANDAVSRHAARKARAPIPRRYNEELFRRCRIYRLNGQHRSSGIERHCERYPNSSFNRQLVVFARLSSLTTSGFRLFAMVFSWFTLILVVAAALAMFLSVFLRWPLDLA